MPSFGRSLRASSALTLLFLCALGNNLLTAQPASEYEVQAAFLYKVAGFVEWPPDLSRPPRCIAVLGQDPFGPAPDDIIEGQSIEGRGFLVRRVKSGQDPAGLKLSSKLLSVARIVRGVR